jgi:hypothetical protein
MFSRTLGSPGNHQSRDKECQQYDVEDVVRCRLWADPDYDGECTNKRAEKRESLDHQSDGPCRRRPGKAGDEAGEQYEGYDAFRDRGARMLIAAKENPSMDQ